MFVASQLLSRRSQHTDIGYGRGDTNYNGTKPHYDIIELHLVQIAEKKAHAHMQAHKQAVERCLMLANSGSEIIPLSITQMKKRAKNKTVTYFVKRDKTCQ